MHTARLRARTRRHAPPRGPRAALGPAAPQPFVPLARPARRAGARTTLHAALGVLAALVVVAVAIVLLANTVRPG